MSLFSWWCEAVRSCLCICNADSSSCFGRP